MAKYDPNIFDLPVDVIDNGTRVHYDTRREAVAKYLEAMMFCEGSAKERYSTIYTELKYGSESVVSDGEPEFIKQESVAIINNKAKLLEMIKNNELDVNSEAIYDHHTNKLVVEDRDIIKALLKQDGCYAAQFLRSYIENDKGLIMRAALGGDDPRGALAYASEQLRDDKDFVLQMIKVDVSDVRYVSDRLSLDPEVIATALQYATSDFDVDSVKESIGTELLTDMIKVYLDKRRETEKEITAKFDFNKIPQEQKDEFYIEVFDTAEEMFNDLYLYDADYQTLRDAIYVLKQQDMHSAVVEHMNVRYDGEKYYYSSEMEEFERVVLESQKASLEDKINEAKGEPHRDNSDELSKCQVTDKDMGLDR